ncbi:MAG: LamG-like jellyroll fold domain-containing protein [Planctomyces sp.]|jgi:hypothetical protein
MRIAVIVTLLMTGVMTQVTEAASALKAGAAVIDITPQRLPVLVNGGMVSRTVDKVVAKLHARAIVLDNDQERIALVVVDSCMIGKAVLDDAKHLAAKRTKIRPERMMISATHTHSAPSSMACLGTEMDTDYVVFLRERLAEVIALAEKNLEPAEAGWSVRNAADYTALRRWIIRPDRIGEDPFGNRTLRANMHAGADLQVVTGESGPEDPDLSLIGFRTPSGRPIAVLANFSMHYFSAEALHPDYFGLFCDGFEAHIREPADSNSAVSKDGDGGKQSPPFVAIISHGCSGDIWRRDYKVPVTAPLQTTTIEEYTKGLLGIAKDAWKAMAFASADLASSGELSMEERRLPMKYRVPDQQRLEWAKRIVAELGDRLPETTQEVYAREQVILHELQSTEIVVQAIRIGEIAIATTPNETYALTGLKLKHQSPLNKTMVIELANGGDGYIPPTEQHLLGGYNTWPARSAGLEVTAEPRITAELLQMLENVCGNGRRKYQQSVGPAAETIRSLRPLGWWRMDEFSGPHAADSSGNESEAVYEPGVVFFLDGPHSQKFCDAEEVNRCAHFVGGRMRCRMPQLKDSYSVSLWVWNGMPVDARPIAGWMFSRDHDFAISSQGEHLGVLGGSELPGRLVFMKGDKGKMMSGTTEIPRWTWNHVVLVRDASEVRIYLNGRKEPEIRSNVSEQNHDHISQMFFGGRSDSDSGWEGRLDEIVVFDRAITADEAASLYVAEK